MFQPSNSGKLYPINTSNLDKSTSTQNSEEIELVTRPHSGSEELFLDSHYDDTERLLTMYKRKTSYTEYFLKFGLHICIHVSFLSILEPLLFFNYIIVIEKDMFFQHFKHFVDVLDPFFSSYNEEVRQQQFYNLATEFFKRDGANADSYFENLRLNAEHDKLLADETNGFLVHKAFMFFFIMLSVTVCYYIAFQYYYRRKLFIVKILSKHLGLMIFIGLYELWFFQNVILKYKPWSESEITYFLMQCIASHFYNYYPEYKFTLQNETVTC